jgi:hypothetical protein
MPKVTPVAESIPFNNVGSDLSSTTVQDAIIEVNTKANTGSGSSFNVNKLLVDNHFDILADNEGNILEGLE